MSRMTPNRLLGATVMIAAVGCGEDTSPDAPIPQAANASAEVSPFEELKEEFLRLNGEDMMLPFSGGRER